MNFFTKQAAAKELSEDAFNLLKSKVKTQIEKNYDAAEVDAMVDNIMKHYTKKTSGDSVVYELDPVLHKKVEDQSRREGDRILSDTISGKTPKEQTKTPKKDDKKKEPKSWGDPFVLGGASIAGVGLGAAGYAALKGSEKKAGYTEHGRAREEARARAYADMAAAFREADKESPGMSYLKGTNLEPIIYELIARKQAYKSQQKGLANLKTHIPFIGMGPKGKEALKELRSKKKD